MKTLCRLWNLVCMTYTATVNTQNQVYQVYQNMLKFSDSFYTINCIRVVIACFPSLTHTHFISFSLLVHTYTLSHFCRVLGKLHLDFFGLCPLVSCMARNGWYNKQGLLCSPGTDSITRRARGFSQGLRIRIKSTGFWFVIDRIRIEIDRIRIEIDRIRIEINRIRNEIGQIWIEIAWIRVKIAWSWFL